MTRVAVYCGSNGGASPAFDAHARALGAALAARGVGLVYGGGHDVLMGVVADAAIAAGGDVCGVITSQLVADEIAHGGLSELVVVDSMHERKARMAELADAFIALPGGYGTLDEVFEVLTWNQIALIAKPVVFLDVDGYYERLFAFLDHAAESELLRPVHRALAQRATSVEEALDRALRPPPPGGIKWIGRAREAGGGRTAVVQK